MSNSILPFFWQTSLWWHCQSVGELFVSRLSAYWFSFWWSKSLLATLRSNWVRKLRISKNRLSALDPRLLISSETGPNKRSKPQKVTQNDKDSVITTRPTLHFLHSYYMRQTKLFYTILYLYFLLWINLNLVCKMFITYIR